MVEKKDREGKEKSRGERGADRRLVAREPDNEICIFMHGCRPEISVVARVFLVAGLLFGHATKNRRSF